MMKRFVNILFLLLVCGAVSCIKMPSREEWEQRQREKDKIVRWTPSECSAGDLNLTSFSIFAVENPLALTDIVFRKLSGDNYSASLERYSVSDLRFAPSWLGTAARVTVNGVDQTPGVSVQDFSKPVTYVLHSSDGGTMSFTMSLVQGIVASVPVLSLYSKETISYGSKSYAGRLRFAEFGKDASAASYDVDIRLMPRNSAAKSKRTYELTLPDKAPVLGMNESRHWQLVANASDRTLLRNKVSHHIASMTSLPWTPDSRYCEVFLNNTYQGLYLMVESPQVGKDRIDIDETEGFLFECGSSNSPVTFRSAVRDIPFTVKHPASDGLSQEKISSASEHIKKIEQCLYREDMPDPRYKELLDINSFVDWWLVVEATHLSEAKQPNSVWFSLDKGGKLCAGPVWDFEVSTFRVSEAFLLYDYCTTDWQKSARSLWYHRLFLDPEFKALAKQRWMQLKPVFQTVPDYIDEQMGIIGESVIVNYEVWTNVTGSNFDNNLDWASACSMMKENFIKKLDAIDVLIETW